ncbi:MAG: penicillin acylase family protein [Flavobacteriales bacterium]|nr:penicillin acylase family protein [Flavobacteriales bacterium]
MKYIKYILLALASLLIVAAIGFYFWLSSSKPTYDGKLVVPGLQDSVNVSFDEYGVPHIEAQNMHDLYLAFGYIHAQDRLFQMELLRRAGSGRLSEIFGRKLLKTDLMLRTIGLEQYADSSVILMEQQKGTQMYEDMQAYLYGINAYQKFGETPPEFRIVGIEKTDFTIKDIFCISGAMAFSFSQAQKTDPVIDLIHKKYGDEYLKDIGLWHDSTESFIPNYRNSELRDTLKKINSGQAFLETDFSNLASVFSEIESMLPYSPLEGSNSWVVGPSKTASGEVMFCNDTHIGYLLPQTWYEAHLLCNSFEMYGHFMAGIPFALVGRNKQLSWGLTMLLNDDMDFYREERNPSNPNEFKYNDQFEICKTRTEVFKIKSDEDSIAEIQVTRHGPVVSGLFDGIYKESAISMLWTYTRKPNKTFEAFYGLNHSTNIDDFSSHLQNIHGPGLSVNYGDNLGNIAWWACASLLERPEHVNSWTILDGNNPANDPIGYYPFEMNPRCINPSWGYIYSANDWPDKVDGKWYPGYYKPQYRADQIRQLLTYGKDFDLTSMSEVMTDVKNNADAITLTIWGTLVKKWPEFDTTRMSLASPLFYWDGSYDLNNCSPTLFNKMLYHVMRDACADEMGQANFDVFVTTHQFQRAMDRLCSDTSSGWWDNVNTPEKEIYTDVIRKAFKKSFIELSDQLGSNPKIWYWSKVCTLELRHPLGEVAVFRPLFNIGPEPVMGGNETIMQSGFKPDSTGEYKVYFGSQMRIMVDFAHPDSAWNVTPAGQSGHLMSEHYSDQWTKYRKGEFRTQWMDVARIKNAKKLVLVGQQ